MYVCVLLFVHVEHVLQSQTYCRALIEKWVMQVQWAHLVHKEMEGSQEPWVKQGYEIKYISSEDNILDVQSIQLYSIEVNHTVYNLHVQKKELH